MSMNECLECGKSITDKEALPHPEYGDVLCDECAPQIWIGHRDNAIQTCDSIFEQIIRNKQ